MNQSEVVKDNPFQTKKDFENVLESLVRAPFEKLDETHRGVLDIGVTRTLYPISTVHAEGFLRLLWGMGPFYAKRPIDERFLHIIQGIKEGIDENHPNFWGKVESIGDQLMVEMAPLAFFLTLNKEKVLETIQGRDRENLIAWLDAINRHDPWQNNWMFFRVLVNMCFTLVFEKDQSAQLEKDFATIEGFYIGDGWYKDGVDNQRDYYIPFAMHYYSLLYAKLFADIDPKRSQLFKERAVTFAKDFRHWFDKLGRGIPFGRSLTYRFAQSSFWSAMLFADVVDFPKEASKKYLAENLRFWLSQEIFSETGILKIGYAYDNLNMSEQYNAPGSPYWALKAFALLALDESDEIFSLSLGKVENLALQKHIEKADMIVARKDDHTEVQAFPAGQHNLWARNGGAKYNKFVYSTTFAYCVSTDPYDYERGGFDCTLAVSEQDNFYRHRQKVDSYEITDDYVKTIWKPWENVTVVSYVIPCYPYHIRIHVIDSARKLSIADAGFSVPFTQSGSIEKEIYPDEIILKTDIGISGIKNIEGFDEAKRTGHIPNANLNYACVSFPYLVAKRDEGHHVFLSQVLGDNAQTASLPPEITRSENLITIKTNNKEICINLES